MIRGGSWPIQSFGGEFRYNLVVDSGHDFWRSAADHTQIHHNVFVHASGLNTGYDGGFKVYGGESGLDIYNNTFDVGGATGGFDAPAFSIGSGSLFQSIRNNLFTTFIDVSGTFGAAFVSSEGPVVGPRVDERRLQRLVQSAGAGLDAVPAGHRGERAGAHDVQANPQAVRTDRDSVQDLGGVHLAGAAARPARCCRTIAISIGRPPAARSSTRGSGRRCGTRSSARSVPTTANSMDLFGRHRSLTPVASARHLAPASGRSESVPSIVRTRIARRL